MLQAYAHGLLPEASAEVIRDALIVVRDEGGAAFQHACERIGTRLAQSSVLKNPEDVAWLDWEEARQALQDGASRQALVEARQAAGAARPAESPATIGPDLAKDAPRMYLVREILALFG